MKKRWQQPVITECLVIRRTVRSSRERERGAVQLFEFVQRNVDAGEFPVLARAVTVLGQHERVPRTEEGLARRSKTSRTTLWREWRGFGLGDVSLNCFLRAALVWRVHSLEHEGISLPEALQVLGLEKRTYRAAVELVNRALNTHRPRVHLDAS